MILCYLILIIGNLSLFFESKKRRKKEISISEKVHIEESRKQMVQSNLLVNLLFIGVSILNYIMRFVFSLSFAMWDLLFFVGYLLSFFLFLPSVSKKRREQKYVLLNTGEEKRIFTLLSFLFSSLIFLARVGEVKQFGLDILGYIAIFISISMMLFSLGKFLSSNKKIVSFRAKEQDYLQDVKFYTKINMNSYYPYVILLFCYIMLLLTNIPYFYIFDLFILVFIGYVIYQKSKKFRNQSEQLYRNIAILNRYPGIPYAFDFYRDILLTKRMIWTVGGMIFTCASYYLLGSSAFILLSIETGLFLFYLLLLDQKKMIYAIYSLNHNFIDTKMFSIYQEVDITEIRTISILGTLFYKLVYIGENQVIYESSLIMYDPELYIQKIKLYQNPHEIGEYVISLGELYQ